MTTSPLDHELLPALHRLFESEPGLASLTGIDIRSIDGSAAALAATLASCVDADRSARVREIAEDLFGCDPAALESALDDLLVTAARDAQPGGIARVLLFANGYHALLAYRLTRALWLAGREDLALSIKVLFTRATSTEIWPQSEIGKGVWIDHGLGIVIGQTAIVEDDVSLWHGVTLGSNFVDMGGRRHPKICHGAILGAGALVLGPITVGEGAVIGAGAIVTRDVAPGQVVTGPRAKERGASRIGGFQTLSELKKGHSL